MEFVSGKEDLWDSLCLVDWELHQTKMKFPQVELSEVLYSGKSNVNFNFLVWIPHFEEYISCIFWWNWLNLPNLICFHFYNPIFLCRLAGIYFLMGNTGDIYLRMGRPYTKSYSNFKPRGVLSGGILSVMAASWKALNLVSTIYRLEDTIFTLIESSWRGIDVFQGNSWITAVLGVRGSFQDFYIGFINVHNHVY